MMKTQELVDHLFRIESANLKSVLTHYFGLSHIDIVEDIVQDTLLRALQTWPFKVPENPKAWLYTAAKNIAIDYARKSKSIEKLQKNLIHDAFEDSINPVSFSDEQIKDDQLRMIYTACHPSIPIESQIAFSLRTLFAFSIAEIAEALMIKAANVEKQIYRAKMKFRNKEIEYKVPVDSEISKRSNAVLHVLYLIFNKGYYSNSKKQLFSFELCSDALRLAKNLKATTQVHGLLALFYFHISRFPARFNNDLIPINLKHQDRSLYDFEMIRQGHEHLQKASDSKTISYYIIEATISLMHSSASSYEETDWTSILALYKRLYEIKKSESIYLNMIVVRSNIEDPKLIIKELLDSKSEKKHSYYLILSDLYQKINDTKNSKTCLEKALETVQSEAEAKYIKNKIEEEM